MENVFSDVLTGDPKIIMTIGDDMLIKISKYLTKTVKESLCHLWYERK